MKIKDAFILAAGLGTRMGDLGQEIPKPLFPIFNKSIIEIIIEQLKGIGIENIYINSHHLEIVLRDYLCTKFSGLNFLSEKQLLGSGGAFFNLKKNYPNLKYIISMNADTVFDINKNVLSKLESSIIERGSSVSLMGLNVANENRFNRLVLENKILKGITPYSLEEGLVKSLPWTFSGVAAINLERLDKKFLNQKSSFFDSVANFKNNSIEVITPSDLKFHDFGTLDYYCSSLKAIMTDESDFLHAYSGCQLKPYDNIFAENELCRVEIKENVLSYRLKF